MEPPQEPLDPQTRAQEVTRLMATIYLSVLVFMVVMQAISDDRHEPVLQRFLPGERLGWLEIPLGAAVALGVILIERLARPYLTWLNEFQTSMHTVLGKPRLRESLTLAGTSALVEEVAFRGILQTNTNLLVASLFFGLAHFTMWQWAAVSVLIGMLLGGLFHVTDGGLLAPFTAHFVINLAGLVELSRSCPATPPLRPLPLESSPPPR